MGEMGGPAGHARPPAEVGDGDRTEMDLNGLCFGARDSKEGTEAGRPRHRVAATCCETGRPLVGNHEVATRGRVADEAARVEWTRWESRPNSVPSGPGPNLGAEDSEQERSLAGFRGQGPASDVVLGPDPTHASLMAGSKCTEYSVSLHLDPTLCSASCRMHCLSGLSVHPYPALQGLLLPYCGFCSGTTKPPKATTARQDLPSAILCRDHEARPLAQRISPRVPRPIE
ncbi:hypothetical protein DHEL01_v209297 [Diaporthe helianthi]|uniref:Uncharacterized protein n=1 Tax=Diaporthe helianthi TaxID=158607 RepID=A0A2P5HPX7_DIAHE|nr:hypothetical protein DHEL01_v209297 [Diaporthe helianthi]